MESKREQALVGLFVIVAACLVIVTALLLSGTFGKGNVLYHAYFKNAGGLAPGSEVRYAGGPPIGRVEKVASDPDNPTRMLIDFDVQPSIPIKADSTAQITSVSPLGDNFLGIIPGTAGSPKAPAGSTLKSEEFTSFADIATLVSQIAPSADQLIANLNDRVVTLKVTLDRVNDLLNDENRAHIAGSLGNLNGMLAEDRPAIHSTLSNVSASSAKLSPLIDNFQKTSEQANVALGHLDATVSENRPDLHKAIANLRQTLDSAVTLTNQLNATLDTNTENLDEIIDNLRHITDNMNEFTNTIKTRPYTLIRASGLPARKPGQAPPK